MERIRSLSTWMVLVNMLPVAPKEKEERYGKKDIYFGKFYKAATHTNKKLLKDVFTILFYETCTSQESRPDTVEDYCFDILKWSRKKYRDSFNVEERKQFCDSIELLDGDVSLLNKLIMKLFDDANLPSTFLSALRELKNARNRVCHDEVDFTGDSLQSDMEELKFLFKKILSELGCAFQIDISKYECKYCDEVDEIMAAPITGEGLSYFDKMEKFREDLMGKFLVHGRKELFMFYVKLKVLNPFTWLKDEKFPELLVDKIFTPLHICDESIVVDIKDLLVTEMYVEKGGEYVCTGNIPSAIVLSGIAGCGKTSLCRYLLHDWRNKLGNVASMGSVDILILIEARNVQTSSLVSYLQQVLLKETCSHFEEKDILPTLQKLNALYVVDGVDEATENGKLLLEEILSLLDTSRIILTTRPEFISSIVDSLHDHHLCYIKLQVHGFADAGVAQFTSKIFHALETNEQRRMQQEEECLKFLKESGVYLGCHLKIPLTVALLIILWRDKKSSVTNITSVTTLYAQIFKMCSMKLSSRVRKSATSTYADLDDIIENLLLELGHQSFEMLKKDEYVIDDQRRKQLSSYCNKHNIDNIHALSSFLICEVQESLFGVHHTFTFIHKSQMEYLAGKYIADSLIKNYEMYSDNETEFVEKVSKLNPFIRNSDLSFEDILELRKMMNVYFFATGHLCAQSFSTDHLISTIAEGLITIARMNQNTSALWRLVQESERNPLVCKMVSESISGKFIWRAEGDELCDPSDPVFQLLKYTDFIPKKVLVRTINSTNGLLVRGESKNHILKPYKNLVPLFQCIRKKSQVEVVLKADQHFYNWGGQETTDHVLEALNPGSNLTSLMAHLGISGAKSIASFKSLEFLDVRISSAEALEALSESVKVFHGDLLKKSKMNMNLRLDLSHDALPSSLPRFNSSLRFNISLFNIKDNNASWAIEVLSQVSKHYRGIELLSSKLSSRACKIFLCTLKAEGVKVEERIHMPLFSHFSEKEKEEMEKCVQCKLELW